MITNDDFLEIFDYIKERTGINIVESNINAVRRFIHKKTDDIMNIKKYITVIQNDLEEFHQLLQVITINETYFFREQKYYKLMDEVIFPEFRQNGINPVLWSGASSTGEEPISLAILYNKHFSKPFHMKPVIATDIDVHSMDSMKRNRYTKSSTRDDGGIFHDIIYSNSVVEDGHISLNKNIMDLIDIKKLNLINDNFHTVLGVQPSVICLCNVLIYMSSDIRKSIVDRAVEELQYGGYLFVSSSNTAFIEHPELELIQTGNSFYFKKTERDSNG